MDPDRILGTEATVRFEVTDAMRPAFDGVVVHDVYSTWSMAHHMEIAARRVLAPHLVDGEEGIGSHLSIDHVSPLPVGKTARVVATCVEADATTVVCTVTAYDGDADRVVGRGRQIQRVLPRAKLDERIARHQ